MRERESEKLIWRSLSIRKRGKMGSRRGDTFLKFVIELSEYEVKLKMLISLNKWPILVKDQNQQLLFHYFLYNAPQHNQGKFNTVVPSISEGNLFQGPDQIS